MNLYEQLIPTINLSLKETGIIMLPVTGTLLGLVYAAFIYWLQGAFAQLEHTRSLLEDLLVANGKVLLDLLVGASVVSLFAILEATALASLTLWIFSIVFVVDLMKAVAEAGYIATIFSTGSSKKSILSHYSPFKQFLRKIRNAGPAQWFRIVFLVGLLIVYPLWISFRSQNSWILSETSLISFIFVSSTFALLQIRSLMTEAFQVQKQLDGNMMKENEKKALQVEEPVVAWSGAKRIVEQKIISERLQSIGVVADEDVRQENPEWTSRDLDDKPVVYGGPIIQTTGSCYLNIVIPYLTSDEFTREFIFEWTQIILVTLAESKTEVSYYTIAFSRRDGGGIGSNFGMIRASRDEVCKTLSKKLQGKEFVKSLSGRYLAPAVAEF